LISTKLRPIHQPYFNLLVAPPARALPRFSAAAFGYCVLGAAASPSPTMTPSGNSFTPDTMSGSRDSWQPLPKFELVASLGFRKFFIRWTRRGRPSLSVQAEALVESKSLRRLIDSKSPPLKFELLSPNLNCSNTKYKKILTPPPPWCTNSLPHTSLCMWGSEFVHCERTREQKGGGGVRIFPFKGVLCGTKRQYKGQTSPICPFRIPSSSAFDLSLTFPPPPPFIYPTPIITVTRSTFLFLLVRPSELTYSLITV
jgi:hypothetical protein